MYFRSKHPDKKKFSRMSEKISWTTSMVYKLLTSYSYVYFNFDEEDELKSIFETNKNY